MAALIGGGYVFNAPFSKGSPLVITAAARHDTPLKLEVAVTPFQGNWWNFDSNLLPQRLYTTTIAEKTRRLDESTCRYLGCLPCVKM